jgi:hypothetical protein
MSTSRLCCRTALSAAFVELLVFGLAACAVGAPIDPRGQFAIPIGGFSAAATGGAASSPPPPPMAGAAGMAPPVAGVGTAGTWAVAGQSGGASAAAAAGSAGIITPVAGSGGGEPTQLPAFDAGTDLSRNMVHPGALCARFATIQCAGEAHCCNTRTRTTQACQVDLTMSCSQQYLDQIAQNPVTGFDAAATASAFTQLEQRASQCDINILAWAGSPEGMRTILKGTLAAGASCKPSGDPTDPPTAGAALASCTNGATIACLPKSLLGDWTCAPKNSAGGSCVTDNNCNSGFFCNNPNKAPLGKCAQLYPLGSTCVDGSQCASLVCKASQCVAADQQVVYCGQ